MKQTPKRVLVIDDELDHCEIIEECLSLPGRERFDVTFAHTVRDACRILAQQDFSFVLLDHNLPDGHGTDILERMQDRLLATPVIGLSTSQDPDVIISDYHLVNGEKGFDAIDQIRREFSHDIFSVLMTSDPDPKIRDLSRKKGHAYMSKPLNMAKLRALLSKA